MKLTRIAIAGLLVASAGCRSSEPEPPPAAWTIDEPAPRATARETAQPPAAEGPRRRSSDEAMRALTLDSQEKKAQAARELELGLAAYEQLDYERAEKHFAAALEAWPGSEAAIVYLEKTQRIRGTRDDVWTDSASRLAAEREVHVQQRQVEAEGLYRQGLQLLNSKQYDRAIARFEQVLEITAWFPYHTDPTGSLALRAQRKLDRARTLKREADRDAREELERQAFDRARADAQRRGDQRAQHVRRLIRLANDHLNFGRFRRAVELAEEALRFDPGNPDAYRIRQEAIRRRQQKDRSSGR